MPFKMTRAQLKERDAIMQELTEQGELLKSAVTEVNEALSNLGEIRDGYNAALEKAKEFVDGIAEEAQSEFDDKSEKWQEGERGDAVSSWIDELRNADLPEEIDLTVPEDIPEPDISHAETLGGLPEDSA